MMVVTGRTGFRPRIKSEASENALVTTITTSGYVLGDCTEAMGRGTTINASGVAPALTRSIWVAALRRSRALQPTLVAIIAADVDRLQSIACPHTAPAVAIVVGVEIGIANERKATVMEAVMERKP